MNEGLILDIDDIQIIVSKREEADFYFHNPNRTYDGFVMITMGKGFATGGNGKRYSISERDIIFLNKNDHYTLEFEGVCSYVTSGLTLNADKKLLPFIHRCTEGQYKKIKDICKKWQSRSWDSYASCRIGLMDFYLEIIQDRKKEKPDDDYVSKAISYIHKNYKSNFSGNEIAEYCSVSISYLRSSFLKQTGQTIGKYRDYLRIAAAKEMLESGYFTVTEIAAELGYCDVYHFSKIFSAYTDCPPTKWKPSINSTLRSSDKA